MPQLRRNQTLFVRLTTHAHRQEQRAHVRSPTQINNLVRSLDERSRASAPPLIYYGSSA
jgi:hypothetical protein